MTEYTYYRDKRTGDKLDIGDMINIYEALTEPLFLRIEKIEAKESVRGTIVYVVTVREHGQDIVYSGLEHDKWDSLKLEPRRKAKHPKTVNHLTKSDERQ